MMITTPIEDRNCLLIAMPQLLDPNFNRTVSLMASFDEKGAFGFILNRLLDMTADQLLANRIDFPTDKNFPIFFGGPVQVNTLWFLHAYPEHFDKGIKVNDQLFLTTELKTVEAVVKAYRQEEIPLFRFFLGYAGWAPGQLENEIARASWVTGPVDIQELFHCDPEKYWKVALSRLGINDPSSLVAPSGSGSAH